MEDLNSVMYPVSSGFLAADTKQGGLKIQFGAKHLPPISPVIMEMSLLASSVGQNISFYQYSRDICWDLGSTQMDNFDIYLQYWLLIPR